MNSEHIAVSRVDWKSVGLFVLIAVILAAAWVGLSRNLGLLKNPQSTGFAAWVAQLTVLISAFIVMRWVCRQGYRQVGWRVGPLSAYLATFAVVVGIIAIVAAVSLGLGYAKGAELAELKSGRLAVSLSFFLLISCLFAFAEEFGWRGFLLPKLLPLGPKRALLASGPIWFRWEAPLVIGGLLYARMSSENLPAALTLHFFQICGIAVALGYLRLRFDSVFLPTFAHGLMNTMGGVMMLLVSESDPIWGDFGGPIGVTLVIIVALLILRVGRFHAGGIGGGD